MQNSKLETYKFVCKECGFRYQEKQLAEACAKWCREHKSCNLEIIKNGIPPKTK